MSNTVIKLIYKWSDESLTVREKEIKRANDVFFKKANIVKDNYLMNGFSLAQANKAAMNINVSCSAILGKRYSWITTPLS